MAEDSFAYLRTVLDGGDGLVGGGHGVISTAGATRHAERMKRVPVWVLDDKKVKEILLRSFPKLNTDEKQRQAALRWTGIIYMYWRAGQTRAQVAAALNMSETQVHDALIRIRRVAAGKRANGTGVLGKRKGRPVKRAPIQAPLGSTGEDSLLSPSR